MKNDIHECGRENSGLTETGNVCYELAKRCFDFLAALILSMILLLPLAVLCVVIMALDFGNPIYMQKRIGKCGQTIRVAKLRSMRIGSDNLENVLSAQALAEYKKEYKIVDDPRLICYRADRNPGQCFGGMIRKTSIDELPQIIWNILIKRNMSFVGPRPILQEELETYYTAEQQKLLLSIRPGLTGYWQAYARNDAAYGTGERQRMELYYVEHRSLRLDAKILFATIGAVLEKRGAN